MARNLYINAGQLPFKCVFTKKKLNSFARNSYLKANQLPFPFQFYGNSTSAILEGVATISLLPRGEEYVMTLPYAHCKGILMGTMTMELGGKVSIECAKTGYAADLEFKLRVRIFCRMIYYFIHWSLGGRVEIWKHVSTVFEGRIIKMYLYSFNYRLLSKP